jgi:hypothetical protein
LLCGCGPSLAQIDLAVGYDGGDRILEPSPDGIALGVRTEADLRLFDTVRFGGGAQFIAANDVQGAEIRCATSSNPEVLRVVSFEGSSLHVAAGRNPGSVELRVATARGEDIFAMHVAEPAAVDVWHDVTRAAPDDPPPVYLAGGTARFRMDRRDRAGRPLGGTADELPIRVDPPGAATIRVNRGDASHVDVHFEREGDVVLRPLGGAPVTLTVVGAEAVATATIETFVAGGALELLSGAEIGAGRLAILTLRRLDGARVLALGDRAELVTTTPEVCDVHLEDRWHWDGVYALEALTVGECLLEARFGEQAMTVSLPVSNGE